MSDAYKYDIAFSYLERDEVLAMQLNDRLQDRVTTFIYPRTLIYISFPSEWAVLPMGGGMINLSTGVPRADLLFPVNSAMV